MIFYRLAIIFILLTCKGVIYAQFSKVSDFSMNTITASSPNNSDMDTDLKVIDKFSKKHFNLLFHVNDLDTVAYYKACYKYTLYYKLRYKNTRRIIHFADKKVSIELFSADELSEISGLPADHFLSPDGKVFPKIEFVLTTDSIKEVLTQ